jgi:hypothetical protein
MSRIKNTKTMSKKKLKLNKVSIVDLIRILTVLFEEGADYIDIESDGSNDDQDIIKVTVKPDYYSDEDIIEIKPIEQQDIKLTTDDIDKLSDEL